MQWFGNGHGWRSIEDPQRVRELLEELLVSHRELLLRTEGAQALPYTGQLAQVEPSQERMTVKLLRPLAWELASGARFQMTFAASEGRYDTPTALRGRREYLHYDFALPHAYRPADRRAAPRYPFRPRENVQVLARVGDRMGLLGVLVNLSLGGLGLRIDRLLRLDTGTRVPIQPGIFDAGLYLPSIRIQNLPRTPLLEQRGAVVRTEELREGMLLGVAFADLEPRERELLLRCLERRAALHPSGALEVRGRPEGGVEPTDHPPSSLRWSPPKGDALGHVHAALRLHRRSEPVVLVMAEGAVRNQVRDRLRSQGFHRVDVSSLWHPLLLQDPRGGTLLVAWEALAEPDEEPLALARRLGDLLERAPGWAVAVVVACEDPTLIWGMSSRLRFLPVHVEEEAWWAGALDDLREGRNGAALS